MHQDIRTAMEIHAASLRDRAATIREEAAAKAIALENEADHFDSIRDDAKDEPDDSPVVRMAALALAPVVERVAAKRREREARDAELAAVAAEAPIRDALANGRLAEAIKEDPAMLDAVKALAARDPKFAAQSEKALAGA